MITVYCIIVLFTIYAFVEMTKDKKEIFVSNRGDDQRPKARSPNIKRAK